MPAAPSSCSAGSHCPATSYFFTKICSCLCIQRCLLFASVLRWWMWKTALHSRTVAAASSAALPGIEVGWGADVPTAWLLQPLGLWTWNEEGWWETGLYLYLCTCSALSLLPWNSPRRGFFYVLVVLVVIVVCCNQGLDFIIAIHAVSSVASCINNAQYAKIIMKLSMKYLPYSLFQKHPISFSQIQKSQFSDS